MEILREYLKEYFNWLKTCLDRTWDGDPVHIADTGDFGGIVKFFGAIAGGITGIVFYLGSRSESDAVLPFLVIISGLFGGLSGLVAAFFAASVVIVVYRIALSLLILFGPPALAYLIVRAAVSILAFLFTPIY